MAKKRTSSAPWYSEAAGFFGPEYLKEYPWLTPQRTKAQVNFLVKVLALRRGTKILDCPCGHGRHAIELARRGYQVTGQDLNGFFLRKAKADAMRARVSIRWHHGDMRDVPFANEFNVALNLFTSFGYFEDEEENQKALDQFAKALKPGGRFVMDIINRDGVIRTYAPRHWEQFSDGSAILHEQQFNHVRGRNLDTRTRISRNGKRTEFIISTRMYALSELVPMLRRAGLTLVKTYGGYDGSPVTLDSKRYILIARKAPT